MTQNIIKFPSPYGDFVFQRKSILSEGLVLPASFRPLTGILFFNAKKGEFIMLTKFIMFPSPYGDFVFQLYNEVLPIHSVF